jgi:hypothetical protein
MVQFWILDFGFWIKELGTNPKRQRGLVLAWCWRDDHILNPKSKI